MWCNIEKKKYDAFYPYRKTKVISSELYDFYLTDVSYFTGNRRTKNN
jgi:hypothetical protein